MIVEVLAANAVSMSVRVVSPAKYARIRDIGWEEVMKPVNPVCCRPGLIAVSVQSMDGNDTEIKSEQSFTAIRNSLLYVWLFSFRHNFETLEASLNGLLQLRRITSLLSLSATDKVGQVSFWMSTMSSRSPFEGISRRSRDDAILKERNSISA